MPDYLKILAQLEIPGLQEEQVEDLLGELSAVIFHLHEHTRGLDEFLDKNGWGSGPTILRRSQG